MAVITLLARDGHPFSYFELGSNNTAREFLDRFGGSGWDIPIVICNNEVVLRNPSPKE